jgi:tetratricopeptide (TPR) repeat protein
MAQNLEQLNVPIEGLVVEPLRAIVDSWAMLETVVGQHPVTLPNVAGVFALLRRLIPHSALDDFRVAVESGDPRALNGLHFLEVALNDGMGILFQRCMRWKQEERWTSLRHESELSAEIAKATGQREAYAQCMMSVALARRRLQDRHGAIEAYRETISAPSADPQTLAAAHANLSLTLFELQQLDDALFHSKIALEHQRDPRERIRILHNRACVLEHLGRIDEAIRELEGCIDILEQRPEAGEELAVALDNLAKTMSAMGRPSAALPRLERARSLFADANEVGRGINALNRAVCLGRLQLPEKAAEAFQEAHDLAFRHARASIDKEHYRRGFAAAMLSKTSDATSIFAAGLKIRPSGNWKSALDLWTKAERQARDGQDHALALRIQANIAGLLFDCGDFATARKVAWAVAGEAAKRGMARPELMALAGLASLSNAGVEEIHHVMGPLSLYARSLELLRIHSEMAAQAGLEPAVVQSESSDPGSVSHGLAILAEKHHAYALAIHYCRDAITRARATGDRSALINRLSMLCKVQRHTDHRANANEIAMELEALSGVPDLPRQSLITLHAALGDHCRESGNRADAIHNFQRACAFAEEWRTAFPPGRARAQALMRFPQVHRALSQLLRESGDDLGAYEALLGGKGRRFIDALTSVDRGLSDIAPTLSEVQRMLNGLRAGSPTVLVDIVVESGGITVYLVGPDFIRSIHVNGDLASLHHVQMGDEEAREAALVRLCLTDPLLIGLAEAVAAATPALAQLVVVPDEALRNIPLHAIPVRGRPLCDHFLISYLAAPGLLRFASERQYPLQRALIAGDSYGDLPYAAKECTDIGAVSI